MKNISRIKKAERIIHGVLKIVWDDGYEGVVDLCPVIERGNIFKFLNDPANFDKFRVEVHGNSIGWIDENGDEIEFSTGNLRTKAVQQAELHKPVANMHV